MRALLDTSLDIRRGELLCLIGPSGCGKSTLLNIIGGLLTPTTGTVEVGNSRVRGPLPHEIAFVFQENALFPWCTVIENVKLGMMFQGVPQGRAREPRAQVRSKRSGSRISPSHYPAQLSGGMRQRAALARALSLETGILLMDEPFGALDEQTRMVLGEDLSVLLSRTDKTIVFVTHQPRRSGVPRRPRGGVLGAARHHQGDHRGRRAASAQARLSSPRRSSPACATTLYRAAARGNPQGGGAIDASERAVGGKGAGAS